MSAHKLVHLTVALMCICLLGKNPIFPHYRQFYDRLHLQNKYFETLRPGTNKLLVQNSLENPLNYDTILRSVVLPNVEVPHLYEYQIIKELNFS
jgi:hypothetical protein